MSLVRMRSPAVALQLALVLGLSLAAVRANGESLSDPARPTIDPARFIGERQSSWNNQIQTKLAITRASPHGVVHGVYSWQASSFGPPGSAGFRAVIRGHSFAIGEENTPGSPFMKFVLNADDSITAVWRSYGNTENGVFSKPLPIHADVVASSPPTTFIGTWNCQWKTADFGGATGSATLTVRTVDPTTGAAKGYCEAGPLGAIWTGASKALPSGTDIEQSSLAFHGTKFEWKSQVEFTLMPDGRLKGARYIYRGYQQHAEAICNKSGQTTSQSSAR